MAPSSRTGGRLPGCARQIPCRAATISGPSGTTSISRWSSADVRSSVAPALLRQHANVQTGTPIPPDAHFAGSPAIRCDCIARWRAMLDRAGRERTPVHARPCPWTAQIGSARLPSPPTRTSSPSSQSAVLRPGRASTAGCPAATCPRTEAGRETETNSPFLRLIARAAEAQGSRLGGARTGVMADAGADSAVISNLLRRCSQKALQLHRSEFEQPFHHFRLLRSGNGMLAGDHEARHAVDAEPV